MRQVHGKLAIHPPKCIMNIQNQISRQRQGVFTLMDISAGDFVAEYKLVQEVKW